ncbi:uncharacterized protein TNCV_53161 [Trichonephila clavipes]|nr:uncharacterized protein TNCV_53161 [Trichonephila clavipes]
MQGPEFSPQIFLSTSFWAKVLRLVVKLLRLTQLQCYLEKFTRAVIHSGSRDVLLAIVSDNPNTGHIGLSSSPKKLDITWKTIVLQWISAHCGVSGDEKADFLAKRGQNYLSYALHSIKSHPGSAISFKGSRSYQTAFSGYLTGHLRCMNFEGGKRSFPISPKCNINPFSPQHILQCLWFSCEEAVASPLLFLDFVHIY